MRLTRLSETYRGSHRASLAFDDDVRDWLVQHVKSTPQGARFLDGIVARSIRPAVADYVLDRLSAERPPGDARVSRLGDSFVTSPATGGGERQDATDVDPAQADAAAET